MPPLSPSATRQLLESLGHRPVRKLGQNFLIDGNIVRKSLELAEVGPGDTVVEIGPGLGTLTQALMQTGARVYAVEKDPRLAAHMRGIEADSEGKLTLIEGDALDHPRGLLPTETTAYKIVANLPYAISTPWMAAILDGPLPSAMVLMLQKEAAQRYAAQPGAKLFGSISIFLQAAYDIMPGHDVAASCFYPKPDVGSALLHLRLKEQPTLFSQAARELIRAIFQQRRKQIGTLLRQSKDPLSSAWTQSLEDQGIDLQTRPEQIELHQWITLSERS